MAKMFSSPFRRGLALAGLFGAALFLAMPAAADETAWANGAQSGGSAEQSYRLGTGDKVRVTVYGEDDLGGEFEIDGNGAISLPLIGEVTAAGESASSLEQQIATKLADGYLQNPRVSVAISTYRPFYVIGQVNRPGQFPYVNGMSALNAVALAGGYTTQANEGTIYVRRNGSPREEELPADQMTSILPGDVVRVPQSTFWTVMSVAGPLAGLAAFHYSGF
ncbi:MAG TPA: polysaccharide biosynthesis/export family protein [Rhizomicrobium sp.]|nr:polysaccharide biosynthesis/export family protein [Rhizomicrobium sp.]